MSKTLRSPCRKLSVPVFDKVRCVFDSDKVDDKVHAVWPETASDGEKHYYPCTIVGFRGEGIDTQACVRWDEPETFEKTIWLFLDQIRDRLLQGDATMAKKSVVAKIPK